MSDKSQHRNGKGSRISGFKQDEKWRESFDQTALGKQVRPKAARKIKVIYK